MTTLYDKLQKLLKECEMENDEVKVTLEGSMVILHFSPRFPNGETNKVKSRIWISKKNALFVHDAIENLLINAVKE